MRYAILSDIHANLEALDTVLAKIDEIAEKEPIDQLWFLGDLVGYGPNPNECITRLRERTDIIIVGNHDWAAIGKIDLEDFSVAARISAEWTSQQLTEENRNFLINLPERFEIGDCTLVHGSPYGPLWEYLTSTVLAERSFQYFNTHYCLVGHTHVPVIFQQPDTFANAPTLPLGSTEEIALSHPQFNGIEVPTDEEVDALETIPSPTPSIALASQVAEHALSAYVDPETGQTATEGEANAIAETHLMAEDLLQNAVSAPEEVSSLTEIAEEDTSAIPTGAELTGESTAQKQEDASMPHEEQLHGSLQEEGKTSLPENEATSASEVVAGEDDTNGREEFDQDDEIIPESLFENAEIPLSTEDEIRELMSLLGLSLSKIEVTNEMVKPPEGHWEAPEGYRAIINPGGVGQPRDGDPRAAFMIYDTERGFEFYRVPYNIKKTQEKIIKAGLPYFLAARLAEGR